MQHANLAHRPSCAAHPHTSCSRTPLANRQRRGLAAGASAPAGTVSPDVAPQPWVLPIVWSSNGATLRSLPEACSNGATLPPEATPAEEEQPPTKGFDTVESAVADFAAGKCVVVLDDERRENEGDLIMAADKATPAAMAFFVEHSTGIVCVALHGSDLDRLRLPLMVDSKENNEAMLTAFTITVDLNRDGVTTGVSAFDRASTVRALATPSLYGASDFRRPGHIFPLRYREGGVLVRPGHTEASVDLAELAGCYPAGVICEIVDRRNGSMARTPQLLEFAARYDLKCITVEALQKYRRERQQQEQQQQQQQQQ